MTNLITFRERLDEIIKRMSKKDKEDLENFIDNLISSTRLVLIEELHSEGYITKSVGFRYIESEREYLKSINPE